MSEKKNVPKLRFPEFTEPWEQRKLGEICERITRKNKGNESDLPLTIASQYGLIDQRDFFNKVVAAKDMTNYYLLKKGEFAYNKSYSNGFDYGSIKRLNEYEKGCLSTLYVCFGITSDEVDSDYLECFFDTLNWYHDVATICAEGARNHGLLNVDVKAFFTDVKISLPLQKEEQKRIAECFQQVDTLITLHQRKLDHVKDLKKSMLQKMFPKNGQLYPEVRFPEFTDAWEQRKLGDMGSTFNGLSGKTKDDFGHGKAKFITYMNVFSNPIADLTMTESIEIDKKQKSVKAGDVFFTTSSETPDEVGMSSVMPEDADNIYLNSFCFGYRPTEKFDLNYLAYVLRADSFRKEMTFLAQGISRYNISKNKVMEVCIPVPTIEEQTKVGRYFRNLDNLITLHQRELDHLKLLKKGMLQQMFV